MISKLIEVIIKIEMLNEAHAEIALEIENLIEKEDHKIIMVIKETKK